MKNIFILTILLIFSSCGYRVGNLHRSVPGKHEMISVPTFKNSTMEAGAEGIFTNAMVAELIRADFVKLVPQSRAEVVLEGTIISIAYEASGTITNESKSSLPANAVLNSSYDAKVIVKLNLRRVRDQKIIWNGSFSGQRNLRAAQIGTAGLNSANPNYDYDAKRFTLGVLAKQMMAEAYSRMTEGF